SSHSCRTGRCELTAPPAVADGIGSLPGWRASAALLQCIGLAPAGALDGALCQTVVPLRDIEHDLPRLEVGHDFGDGPSFFGAASPVFRVIEQSFHFTTSATDRSLSPIPCAVIKIRR